MDKSPFFSIIIPSYNCAQYIQQTLRSIYQQTEKDFEILVINDGSPDNLLEILGQETDPRLRVITQPNGGVSRARNRGIQEAQGTYLAFLDSDDVWQPFHLEKARLFFEKYPHFHWYATNIEYAENIKDTDFDRKAPDINQFYRSSWFLEFGPIPLSSSIVLKREIAIKHLHFPEDMKMFEDNVAWGEFAHHAGAIGTFCTPTAIYRQRKGSASQSFLLEKHQEIINRKDLILQQELLFQFSESKEAALYYRKRAIYAELQYLSRLKFRQKRQHLINRKYITGNALTLFLSVYYLTIHILTAVMLKFLTQKMTKIQKEINAMLMVERYELN